MFVIRRAVPATVLASAVVVAAIAAGAPHGAAPAAPAQISISPTARLRLASESGPLDTAQCEQAYHLRCYEPAQLEAAYDERPLFAQGIDGRGQTIVIVDSFGSPTIRHDLAVFDRTFGLPDPPALSIITPAGSVGTATHPGWAGETTLDVEWAHAMAPGARIILVETPTSENEGTSGFPQIEQAEKYVIAHHLGGVISQSFSATEETFPTAQSLLRLRGAYIDAAHSGVSVLAAAGDSGAADVAADGKYYLFPVTSWPDSDPLVTGVGGTSLDLTSTGVRQRPDVVWNETYGPAVNAFFGSRAPDPAAGGGGLSTIFRRPAFQNSVTSVVGVHRGVPDISLSASCNGSVDTYQSYAGSPPGWYLACGTSEATPLFAGIVALADQAAGHPLGNLDPALYALAQAHAPGVVDVTSGTTTVAFRQDGLHRVVGASAAAGYDLASGVGTVDAAELVPELAAYSRQHG
jgi:subtilase family serine protease